MSLQEIISTTILYFEVKPNCPRLFALILKMCSGFHLPTVIYSEWIWPTDLKIIHNFALLDCFSGFREWQNSISGSYKTKTFIDNVPFTIIVYLSHVGWAMHNITTAKEQKNPSNALKLVLLLSEWKKKGQGFSVFLPKKFSGIFSPAVMTNIYIYIYIYHFIVILLLCVSQGEDK